MTTEQLLLSLLSSSVLGGAVGAFIAGRYALRTKGREYEDSYYKLVLAKRIAAYEKLEPLLASLKIVIVDKEESPYHIGFNHGRGGSSVYELLREVAVQSIWLSNELHVKTVELSNFLYRTPEHEGGDIGFAKKHYESLCGFRAEIEELHFRDMLSLHRVPDFLKAKRPQG